MEDESTRTAEKTGTTDTTKTKRKGKKPRIDSGESDGMENSEASSKLGYEAVYELENIFADCYVE